MAIAVDIADRMFDYTDEEKAAEAVADSSFSTTYKTMLWSQSGRMRKTRAVQSWKS